MRAALHKKMWLRYVTHWWQESAEIKCRIQTGFRGSRWHVGTQGLIAKRRKSESEEGERGEREPDNLLAAPHFADRLALS
jgi:hypothetical protein